MPPIGDDPLEVPEFGVEGSLLQRTQFQGESGTKFLQSNLLGAFEVILVVAEEDIVSLIVKGDHTLACELGLVMKKTSKHPRDTMTQSGREIV